MKVRKIRRNRIKHLGSVVVRIRGLCVHTGRWLKPDKDRPVRARHWRVSGRFVGKTLSSDYSSGLDWDHSGPPTWLAFDFSEVEVSEVMVRTRTE